MGECCGGGRHAAWVTLTVAAIRLLHRNHVTGDRAYPLIHPAITVRKPCFGIQS